MKKETVFQARLARHYDELKWLYCELYQNDRAAFDRLCGMLEEKAERRPADLARLDERRLADPDWYKGNSLTGMMMYADLFAKNLRGVQEKLDYVEECGVNCLHLMPLLDMPRVRNDGGYAVSDFTKVRADLGTMEDLEHLTAECRRRGISVCLDFVMNHTSDEHEWALRARNGEREYQERYFFYEDGGIPQQFEQTCPQVFPTTAPGNFTWLPDAKRYVMTTFYPYQWDLNYRNPAVFHDMTGFLLDLANRGIEIVRLDAVPYIWKELGTTCRNLPQVHTIVRMLRMICEIVCPGVLLLGEVVMEPDKVTPYFGTIEKPECHMLYNVTTMATLWHTVAVRDVFLLERQMERLSRLPSEYTFLNYLRCHDDIGWGLEYAALRERGMEEIPHKKYLNDYFTGVYPGSDARGELYNDDPSLGDARLCGTTASLCGLEAAAGRGDRVAVQRAIRCDQMLHGFIFTLSGIPMLYSGDEIGQLNDSRYRDDPRLAADSRYVHRGPFCWEAAARRREQGTAQQALFDWIGRLENIRRENPVFAAGARICPRGTQDSSVLCLVRERGDRRLIAWFHFSPEPVTVLAGEEGAFIDLLAPEEGTIRETVTLPGYGMRWLVPEEREERKG